MSKIVFDMNKKKNQNRFLFAVSVLLAVLIFLAIRLQGQAPEYDLRNRGIFKACYQTNTGVTRRPPIDFSVPITTGSQAETSARYGINWSEFRAWCSAREGATALMKQALRNFLGRTPTLQEEFDLSAGDDDSLVCEFLPVGTPANRVVVPSPNPPCGDYESRPSPFLDCALVGDNGPPYTRYFTNPDPSCSENGDPTPPPGDPDAACEPCDFGICLSGGNEGGSCTPGTVVEDCDCVAVPTCSGQNCLHNRFVVSVRWFAPTEQGQGAISTRSADSLIFSFFEPTNWEMILKILPACEAGFDHWFVLGATASNVGLELTVEDVRTGIVATWGKPQGPPAPAIILNEEFPCD